MLTKSNVRLILDSKFMLNDNHPSLIPKYPSKLPVTTPRQTSGRFTLILGYELCSLLKSYCNNEMQNSNKSVVPLLGEFVSKCNVRQSLMFIYIHIIFLIFQFSMGNIQYLDHNVSLQFLWDIYSLLNLLILHNNQYDNPQIDKDQYLKFKSYLTQHSNIFIYTFFFIKKHKQSEATHLAPIFFP